MSCICVVSPKGGVGKTTLTANLAMAIQQFGLKVSAVDLDPQNALRLHFGLSLAQRNGIAGLVTPGADWKSALLETDSGIALLPFGTTSRAERQRFNDAILHSDLLSRNLKAIADAPNAVLLADLPPGDSAALQAVKALSPVYCVVLMPDSASLSVLPELESGDFLPPAAESRRFFVLNLMDLRHHLAQDITQYLRQRLGPRLLGTVHRDEALPEALAAQQPLRLYSPGSAALVDFEHLAQNLYRWLLASQGAESGTSG
ncbi:cellulose biosynthesis protein BcsQ [Halomonas sp. H10-9-1]|uniref:cellulose biosynthesis protein BcsQ n=1 Tax=Halomonas sp. H10-9-1 TaxID=2950871 RepID=UPI0032DFC749